MQKGNTRDRILAAALDLFSIKGYYGTTIDDIAARVGIKGPSIYKYLKGKADLLRALGEKTEEEYNTGMEEIIVGVVGALQFEVLTFRLKNEYNVDVKLETLPYEYLRWVENYTEIDIDRIQGTSDMKIVKDLKDRPLLLFAHEWSVGMVLDRNKDLKLTEFGKN